MVLLHATARTGVVKPIQGRGSQTEKVGRARGHGTAVPPAEKSGIQLEDFATERFQRGVILREVRWMVGGPNW